MKVTQTNIADDLAASAHILMGETRERIGAVLIRNASVKLSETSDPADGENGHRRMPDHEQLASANVERESLLS